MALTQTTFLNCIALRVGKVGARSAKFGALNPEFEKSATELKQKQNLLNCKSTLQIAPFNIKTLKSIMLYTHLPYHNDSTIKTDA